LERGDRSATKQVASFNSLARPDPTGDGNKVNSISTI
jgi:hypothetical protein